MRRFGFMGILLVPFAVAMADDLEWKFEGSIARLPDAEGAGQMATAFESVCPSTVSAGAANISDFVSEVGLSERSSEALPLFDSRPAKGFYMFIR